VRVPSLQHRSLQHRGLQHRLAPGHVMPALARGPRLGYVAVMSRGPIATVAALLFVLVYVTVAITLPDLVPRLHWSLEALYWLVAGIVWVFPVKWLMYWAAGKR